MLPLVGWCKARDSEIIGTLFFKESTLSGKYRILPQFSRLGAGSVGNYVDELILFS